MPEFLKKTLVVVASGFNSEVVKSEYFGKPFGIVRSEFFKMLYYNIPKAITNFPKMVTLIKVVLVVCKVIPSGIGR